MPVSTKIFPSCEVKMLSKCCSGQLVRMLRSDQAGCYAIYCKPLNPLGKVGIVWIEENIAKFKMYDKDETEIERVLAYHGDLIWEVDHNGPFELPGKKLSEMPRCLVIAEGAKYLNVTRTDQTSEEILQLNLDDSSYRPYKKSEDAAIFGSWKLFLEDSDRPIQNRTEIAAFCVKEGS